MKYYRVRQIAKNSVLQMLKLNVTTLDLLPCIMGYRNNLRTCRSQSEGSWCNITTFHANQRKWLKLKLPSQPRTVTLLVLGAGVCVVVVVAGWGWSPWLLRATGWDRWSRSCSSVNTSARPSRPRARNSPHTLSLTHTHWSLFSQGMRMRAGI